MWQSFLDALVKASAMCDPVAYMYYLDAELETARTCLWRDYQDDGAGPTIRGDARITYPYRRPVLLSSRVRSGHDAC